jgi:hypothetical protein
MEPEPCSAPLYCKYTHRNLLSEYDVDIYRTCLRREGLSRPHLGRFVPKKAPQDQGQRLTGLQNSIKIFFTIQ